MSEEVERGMGQAEPEREHAQGDRRAGASRRQELEILVTRMLTPSGRTRRNEAHLTSAAFRDRYGFGSMAPSRGSRRLLIGGYPHGQVCDGAVTS